MRIKGSKFPYNQSPLLTRAEKFYCIIPKVFDFPFHPTASQYLYQVSLQLTLRPKGGGTYYYPKITHTLTAGPPLKYIPFPIGFVFCF